MNNQATWTSRAEYGAGWHHLACGECATFSSWGRRPTMLALHRYTIRQMIVAPATWLTGRQRRSGALAGRTPTTVGAIAE